MSDTLDRVIPIAIVVALVVFVLYLGASLTNGIEQDRARSKRLCAVALSALHSGRDTLDLIREHPHCFK